jgi:hydrogenase nickel incorporation protein HypB
LAPRLRGRLRVAVLEGNLTGTTDAERIAALGVPVVQLATQPRSHLTPALVRAGLLRLPLSELDLVFFEDVGTPVCPADFDLGEHLRIVALSLIGGDDKIVKYAQLFAKARLVALTKCDLESQADFDFERIAEDLARLNPVAETIRTSVRTQLGLDRLAEWLVTLRNPQLTAGAPAGLWLG